jgi:hypothetical protein
VLTDAKLPIRLIKAVSFPAAVHFFLCLRSEPDGEVVIYPVPVAEVPKMYAKGADLYIKRCNCVLLFYVILVALTSTCAMLVDYPEPPIFPRMTARSRNTRGRSRGLTSSAQQPPYLPPEPDVRPAPALKMRCASLIFPTMGRSVTEANGRDRVLGALRVRFFIFFFFALIFFCMFIRQRRRYVAHEPTAFLYV